MFAPAHFAMTRVARSSPPPASAAQIPEYIGLGLVRRLPEFRDGPVIFGDGGLAPSQQECAKKERHRADDASFAAAPSSSVRLHQKFPRVEKRLPP